MCIPVRKAFAIALLFVGASWVLTGCGCSKPLSPPELKQACLSAAKDAIETETTRHVSWLKMREDGTVKRDDAAEIQARLQKLYADQARYGKIALQDYELPKNLKVKARSRGGGLLNLEHQSRSGPFYHVVGSHRPIREDKMYDMTIYLVYPRWYGGRIKSDYVYVAAHE